MDDIVKSYIDFLSGNQSFTSWTGYNIPSELEKQSNIWVTKAGARVFKKGFYYDPAIGPFHTEWGAVLDGKILLECGNRRIKLQKDMFYIIPDSVKVVARPIEEPFLVWIEFTGSLSDAVLECIGGQKDELIVGQYSLDQLKTALSIANLLQYHPPRYNLIVQSMLWRFVSGYSDSYANHSKLSKDIQRAINYIHQLPTDDKVTVSQLAAISLLSVETFRKKFHNEVGEAPIQYLLRYRITKTKEQLLYTSKSIKEIAYESGFCDPYYFSRLFRHFEGLSPLHFRKKMHAYLEA